jgi:uncharacterized protein YjbI with pentapeptide repeats
MEIGAANFKRMMPTILALSLAMVALLTLKYCKREQRLVSPDDNAVGRLEEVEKELFASIFATTSCAHSPCPPALNFEMRQDAVRKYIAVTRKLGKPVDLRNADLAHMNLSGANLSGARLSGVNLLNSNLSSAVLVGADLVSAKFGDCDEPEFEESTGQSHISAVLRGANLSDAILDQAPLCGADIRGARLGGAKITQSQVNSAIGDTSTKLPERISRPDYWPGEEPSVGDGLR